MTYIVEFQNRITSRDLPRTLSLWKEFCEMETIEDEEIKTILSLIKDSEMAKQLGPHVEQALPLIMTILNKEEQLNTLCLLYDIQTTNSQPLWELLQHVLQTEYGTSPLFSEKLRLTNLRTKGDFQGALSHFLLLNHLAKGNFVYHKAGWGVGRIIDCSFVREQISVEFEHLRGGKKDLPFKTACKSLSPLSQDHFLSLRFSSPEKLKQLAMKAPVELITKILGELGPKTASEIKDLLVGYIIEEDEYSKWWQLTRAKLKKDPFIAHPESTKEPFFIRKNKLTLSSRLNEILAQHTHLGSLLNALWNLIRDFPQIIKDKDTKHTLTQELEKLLKRPSLLPYEKLQIYFLSETILGINNYGQEMKEIILALASPIEEAAKIETISLRKRCLQAIFEYRPDWQDLFIHALLELEGIQIKEYIFKELSHASCSDKLKKTFSTILEHPVTYKDAFLWAFSKAIQRELSLYTETRDVEKFFESFLLLLAAIENKPNMRDVTKKMYTMLTGSRFKIVREFFKETDIPFIREFLLLSSKCQTFSEHDLKVLQSLAQVAHPDLGEKSVATESEQNILWTTSEGYMMTQARLQHVGTVEMVDNAKEIEAARALGDLRENAEYKFALERRSRLQAELKMLSDQFHKARVLTKDDIDASCVGVGTCVVLQDSHGKKHSYTILGPWDANADKNILSSQSKFAEAMLKKRVGDKFSFRDETFVIQHISSFL